MDFNTNIFNGNVMESRDNQNLRYILQNDSQFFMTGFRVLQGQAENGLIPCSKSSQNGKIKLTYEIAGFETLNDLLPVISPDIYQTILRNLFNVVLGVKTNGFLQYENISASFDRTFIDTNNYTVHLIYLPLVTQQNVNSFTQFENSLRSSISDSFQRYPNLVQNALMSRLAQAVATRLISVSEMLDILSGNNLQAAMADQRAAANHRNTGGLASRQSGFANVTVGQSTSYNLGSLGGGSQQQTQSPASFGQPAHRAGQISAQFGDPAYTAQSNSMNQSYPAAPPVQTNYGTSSAQPGFGAPPAPAAHQSAAVANGQSIGGGYQPPAPRPNYPSQSSYRQPTGPAKPVSKAKQTSSLTKRLVVGGACLFAGLAIGAALYFLAPTLPIYAAIGAAALGLIAGVLVFLLAFKAKPIAVSPAVSGMGPVNFRPQVEGGATELLDDVFIPSLVLSGVKTPEKFDAIINKDEFVIGKNPDSCDAVISFNSAVSRTHCKIICRNGAYYIVDLGSSNGTFVNSNRIPPNQETSIQTGDRIKLANSQFVLKSI